MTQPLADNPLPFGLRKVMLTPYTDASCTALSPSKVQLPVSQTFSFKESEDFKDLTGDDETQATHGSGPTVSWELDSGGVPFSAWAIFTGGVVYTDPSGNFRSYKKNVNQSRPWFMVEGAAISDSGGDVHLTVWRCKMNDDMEGEFGYGEFVVSKCKGVGYGSLMADPTRNPPLVIGDLYDIVHNSTVVDIPSLGPVSTLSHGTVTATTIPVTWSALTGATGGYHAYYRPVTGGSPWTQVGGSIMTTAQSITGLTASTSYDIKVCGINASGEGEFAYLFGVTTPAS